MGLIFRCAPLNVGVMGEEKHEGAKDTKGHEEDWEPGGS